MRILFGCLAALLFTGQANAQSCCSGGSGSPIAGGTSQGVLQQRQAEISTSFQYINTNKFLSGDKPAAYYIDNYSSRYQYTRLGYGVSDKLTLSLETGYFYDRTQISLNKRDTVSGSGFGDLIIFPRYSVYTHNTAKTRDEITLGMGMKIPIGRHLDSFVVYTDHNGKNYYTPKPPAVMTTTGSHDFIFYGFAYRGYPETKFRIFTSALYVRKGWNPLGQRFGDYASLSLYAGKTFLKRFGATIELKGEHIGKMDYIPSINMLAIYNLDVNSTGSRKVLFAPQLSYNYKDFTAFVLTEIPLYQYINGTSMASERLITFGAAYRFKPFPKRKAKLGDS
jgi:hypothetical protein